MSRKIEHRYLDPLDAVWIGCAAHIGLRVRRAKDVFASTDGAGSLTLGEPATLDVDDSVAQMILHELCHALVQGPASFDAIDWGLDNETERDVAREHACLRLQAALTEEYGLRRVLAPTTDFRSFYDALPGEPLASGDPRELALATAAYERVDAPPWAPHLRRALVATETIVRAAHELGATRDANDRALTFALVDRGRGGERT